MSHILTVRAFYSCTYEGGLQYLYIPSVYFVFCNDTQWLFTIYMGKTVGSQFGQMLIKIQDW